MKRRILLTGLIVMLLAACTMPTATPIVIPPTNTPRPKPTLTPIPPTATPVQLMMQSTDELINCRYGPGIVYAFVNELKKGTFAHVIGRNSNSTWWYIRDPGNPNGLCWVSADVAEVEGKTEDLPIANPPVISVTKNTLRIEPERIFVSCSQFPQTIFFESAITTNGPALIIWKLETSTGYVSAENTVIFEESGTQTVNGYYQIPVAGDYWIKIHILQPNDMTEQLNFPANCTP